MNSFKNFSEMFKSKSPFKTTTCHCNCPCGTVSLYPCVDKTTDCAAACKRKCGKKKN